MAAANHMPQLKQYCSWMFKREDWEVAHLHKLIEKEYENQGIRKPHNTDACGMNKGCLATANVKQCHEKQRKVCIFADF